MILSDNETRIDMINSKPIARSIVKLIVDNKDEPIVIGVHGDWGAGKSSVLEMIEYELTSKESVACIKFNGWKYQGFEDAKIALMESVVTTLIEERSLKEKAKDIVTRIRENIDWLKVAKGVGSLAVSTLTGVPPMTLIADALAVLRDDIRDPERVAGIVGRLGQFTSNVLSKESTSMVFQEFQRSFDELMQRASVSKLVVLIDDLDRCLPNVAIETLETVRLFMFSKFTAFVIAADESMIEYAVKKHFPDLPENEISREFSRRYLEKLVQVPFKIPALGEIEAKTYITLLMISSVLDVADSESKNRLIEHALDKIRKPWTGQGITVQEIQNILGDNKFQTVVEQIGVSNQISSILSKRSAGNPRQIKRFINTLLLRYDIAHARGYGEDIKLSCLAKLMLLERFIPSVYEGVAANLSPDGTSSFVAYLENRRETQLQVAQVKEGEGPSTKTVDVSLIDAQLKEWEDDAELQEWIKIEPLIGGEDLRPYYFVSKERKDFFLTHGPSEQIREIIQKLMSSRMQIAASTQEIATLSQANAEIVFDLLSSKVQENNDYSNIPPGIDGIRALVELHPALQIKLVDFIKTFPVATVGAWICSGWEKSITDDDCKKQLTGYLQELSRNGKSTVKVIARATLQTKLT